MEGQPDVDQGRHHQDREQQWPPLELTRRIHSAHSVLSQMNDKNAQAGATRRLGDLRVRPLTAPISASTSAVLAYALKCARSVPRRFLDLDALSGDFSPLI